MSAPSSAALAPMLPGSEQAAGEARRGGTRGEGRLAGLDVVRAQAAGQEVVVLEGDRVGHQVLLGDAVEQELFLMIAPTVGLPPLVGSS